jgi:nitroimidazol reductase NimA-like FMN-containing flavoprotein (pyridoxamine 5'-phosphate oxidase superfamily)
VRTEIMTEKDVKDLLTATTIGRLACSRDDHPYIVPTSFVYEDNHLYGFSTYGQKIEWMRTNPHVCVEVDKIADQLHWASVVIIGCYRELRELPQFIQERNHARELLASRSLWWEPAFSFRRLKPSDTLVPLFYAIEIVSMSGCRTVADQTKGLNHPGHTEAESQPQLHAHKGLS